ncbi:Acyltransferase family protein [Flavobacterium xanthum]|uniref:Acyltransferase family protein n=1 Tax=Flavobacterium xanthum TaxID=69322 RepID=A0A1M6YBD3_9FLAO|nr:Acyltransferase family protein [Flavobacterium xanthum]
MVKKHIKGLDGLRGLAAILVILGHVELIKKSLGLKNLNDGGGPFILYLGNHAVTFFFVLSGFLITYLLLNEKEFYSKIEIKNFYLRRLLRI